MRLSGACGYPAGPVVLAVAAWFAVVVVGVRNGHGGIVGFLRRRRVGIASGTVVVVAGAALVAFALSATGYPVHHADLNDGGGWVTDGRDGVFGRMNGPGGQPGGRFYPPGAVQAGYQLDVLQDAAAVAAWDRGAGVLLPVNVTAVHAPEDAKVTVPATDQVGIGGGSLAALDPASGRLWATRVDPGTGIAS